MAVALMMPEKAIKGKSTLSTGIEMELETKTLLHCGRFLPMPVVTGDRRTCR